MINKSKSLCEITANKYGNRNFSINCGKHLDYHKHCATLRFKSELKDQIQPFTVSVVDCVSVPNVDRAVHE